MSNKNLIAPPPLLKGDKIGVVSMSSLLDESRLLFGQKYIEDEFGLEIVLGKNILLKHHNFAGKDEERLEDFQAMIDNPEIKAIIAGRGGYGASRIIDAVDWRKFKKNPKWIVGFSDLTAVHLKLQSLGYQSIHGPMMVTLVNDVISSKSLENALFGKALKYSTKGHKLNKLGSAVGQILGGNLCLLTHNVGSKADISFDGKILFIEDIGEYLYNIDRMMVQLKRAGKLKNLGGLIVGQFSDSKENGTTFGKTAYEIIQDQTKEYSYPICYNFPIGHENENRAVRCGEIMKLDISKDKVILKSTI